MLRKNDFFHHAVINILGHIKKPAQSPTTIEQPKLYRIFSATRYFPK
jgi:hypothetical protein